MAACQSRLFESSTVAVADFVCRAEVSGWSREESSRMHELILPRAGLFLTRFGNDPDIVADKNHFLLIDPARPYRVAHPEPGGDECTGIFLREDLLRQLLSRYDRSVADCQEILFPFTHGLISPAVSLLHHRLLARLRNGASAQLETEDTLFRLLDELFAALYSQPTGPASRRRLSPIHHQRAVEVKRILGGRFREPLRLKELAATVGTTPFHLSRTFHEAAGIPISRYVRQLRLQESLRLLAAGAESLTDLALELGFSDHSHFTNTFRREFGMPPSAFRRLCRS